ncbi:hypothetical protein RN607_00770 [Demequina capsici]|uniref:Uncharacterized protein n=1 Tax=Demequina capsici TaxID=3075620 RepID=A0AA96FFD1_9MICO|nr:hypothetical protein [Demequina sp. PMTSA13]WNM27566.1 hypothetical protein RN607_00770 [Demequina sp. PMTSA13]
MRDGPQFEFGVDAIAGRQAVVHRASGELVGWIVRDGDRLRMRRGAWISEPADTIPQLFTVAAARMSSGRVAML